MKRKVLTIALAAAAALALPPGTAPAQQNGGTQPNGAAEEGIRLNFKGASLDTVLDYLSRAAGLVVIKEAGVDGELDVVSHQPLSIGEAVALLNTVLHERGLAAIRRERTLTIVDRGEAKTKDIPVRTGSDPAAVPKTDEMITQIIPVRYTDATQLIENLQPLMAPYATLSANESSNAVIITDTQANIHRMMQIIRALDTSISGISAIRVFPLQYTDAAGLANVLTELFEEDGGNQNQRGGRGGGPPFFPGRFGRGGDEDDGPSGDSEARRAASRVVAVADENTNSLIVSAPEEWMPTIENLVREVDTVMEDITEIRVFKLEHANAEELAEQIQELFPGEDDEQQSVFPPRFGPPGFGGPGGRGGRGGGGGQEDMSQRQLQQSTVRAVADPRTNSIMVIAARETMTEIAGMIEALDIDPSRKQKVFVYRLEYADVDNVAEILRNIFESQNTNINRDTDQNANTLGNRQVEQPSFQQGNTQFN